MRPNALACVCTRLHEKANHRGIAPQHCIVQSSMLIVLGPVRCHQLRAAGEQGSYLRNVAGLYRLGESRDVRTLDEGLQLGPTGKAVSARKHPLRVAEGELFSVRVAFEHVYFCHRIGRARAKLLQKFLGLFSQLLQAGLIGQMAGRSKLGAGNGHDDLLFVAARCPRIGLKEDSPYELSGSK